MIGNPISNSRANVFNRKSHIMERAAFGYARRWRSTKSTTR
jgi:hypothetical protein